VDILAQTLWAGAGMAVLRRRWPIVPRTVALTMGLAALPGAMLSPVSDSDRALASDPTQTFKSSNRTPRTCHVPGSGQL